MTVSMTIECAKGYARGMGKYSKPSRMARIDGINGSELQREFLEANSRDWGDSKLYKTGKGTWTETFELEPGIYEITQWGERSYIMVYQRPDKMIHRVLKVEDMEEALSTTDSDALVEAFTVLAAKEFAATGNTKAVTLALAAAEANKE